MRVLLIPLVASASLAGSAQQLYTSGPFATGTHGSVSGAQVSQATAEPNNAQGTCGFNMSEAGTRRVMESFTVPPGENWVLSRLKVYGYQTGSGTESTLRHIFVKLYSTRPTDDNAAALWGNWNNTRFLSSSFTNVYRTYAGDTSGTTRPIMEAVGDLSLAPVLTPGTYHIAWSTTGVGASGPWQIPVTPRPANPQSWVYDPTDSRWEDAFGPLGDPSGHKHDMAFKLEGSARTHASVVLRELAGTRRWGFYVTNFGAFNTWKTGSAPLPTGWLPGAFGDLDGSGRSDMVLAQTGTGKLGVWTLNRQQILGWRSLPALGVNESLVGSGDFFQDGVADLVVFNSSTRRLIVRPISANWSYGTARFVGNPLGATQRLLGIGDFSGDGKPDLLVDTGAGKFGVFVLNGLAVQSWAQVGSTSSAWTVAGVADVDMNGHLDIAVYTAASKQVGAYLMNRTAISGWRTMGAIDPTKWAVVGVVHL